MGQFLANNESDMDHDMVESDGGNPHSNLHYPEFVSQTELQSYSDAHIDIGSQAGLEIVDANNATQTGCRPYVGKEFPNIEDAYMFYNAYARVKGFGIRRQSSNASRNAAGEIISKTFVCDKEGRKYLMDKREYGKEVFRRRETKVGCKARMRLKLTKFKTWEVSVFIEEHNGHDLTSPDKVGKHRSHRRLHQTKRVKELVYDLGDEGLPPATISKVVNVVSGDKEEIVTPQQCHKIIRTQRKNNIGQECLLVIKQFQERSVLDTDFYFSMQVDNTGTMRSVFWADGRSRSSWLTFGDVVVFDVTYKTNNFSLPFAPFTGVNHHRQSTLFGCALLADEKEDTFVWLFTKWLKCMHNVNPTAIIIDQDGAMCNAIHSIFPNTHHRYCKWHLDSHIIERLRSLQRLHGEDFETYFNKWCHGKSIEECNEQWELLKQRYKIKEEEEGWLQTMYKLRDYWVQAYLKNTFFAGMKSSQRSESINAFFDSYVNANTQFNAFVQQYDKAVTARRATEAQEDFMNINTKPVMCFSHPIKIQVGKSYTRAIFDIFQNELKCCMSLSRDEVKREDFVIVYKVGGFSSDTTHEVICDQEKLKFTCACAMFETSGILCRHILKIMLWNECQSIPEHYILHRWTIHARHRNVGINNLMLGRRSASTENQWNVLHS